MHRLTQVDYNNTWQTANEDYVYHELGNRVTYSDHRNSITRAYANDKANQYTSIAGYTVTHDDAGNLASQGVNGSGDAYVYTYDCDNRLLKVDHDPTTGGNVTVATFAYCHLSPQMPPSMIELNPAGFATLYLAAPVLCKPL